MEIKKLEESTLGEFTRPFYFFGEKESLAELCKKRKVPVLCLQYKKDAVELKNQKDIIKKALAESTQAYSETLLTFRSDELIVDALKSLVEKDIIRSKVQGEPYLAVYVDFNQLETINDSTFARIMSKATCLGATFVVKTNEEEVKKIIDNNLLPETISLTCEIFN